VKLSKVQPTLVYQQLISWLSLERASMLALEFKENGQMIHSKIFSPNQLSQLLILSEIPSLLVEQRSCML
jgi:hypothetical protein